MSAQSRQAVAQARALVDAAIRQQLAEMKAARLKEQAEANRRLGEALRGEIKAMAAELKGSGTPTGAGPSDHPARRNN